MIVLPNAEAVLCRTILDFLRGFKPFSLSEVLGTSDSPHVVSALVGECARLGHRLIIISYEITK